MIKNEKGITIISLVVTVIIMIIIVGSVIYSSTSSLEIKALNNLYADIRILEDKIDMYYLETGSIPTTGGTISNVPDVIKSTNPMNNENYYVIDKSKLENMTLTYGDVFIVNEQSHTVYYWPGVSSGNVTYYTIPIDYPSYFNKDQLRKLQ